MSHTGTFTSLFEDHLAVTKLAQRDAQRDAHLREADCSGERVRVTAVSNVLTAQCVLSTKLRIASDAHYNLHLRGRRDGLHVTCRSEGPFFRSLGREIQSSLPAVSDSLSRDDV
ncbi:hypothetical protein PAMP_015172 [Pampus punctatissimus]